MGFDLGCTSTSLYPPETEDDIQRINAAQKILRSYHRRFHCEQQCILQQLKGKSSLFYSEIHQKREANE